MEEAMSVEEHQDLLEKLLEAANCPVCFNILQPPVTQCVNGHGICEDCRSKVGTCPTCREQFAANKSTLLNQILELFPHECQFKGCQEFVKSKNDHEKWCGYRPTKCKICEWNGCAKDILGHVETIHKDLVVLKEKNEGRSWKNFQPDLYSCSVFIPISAHGHFLWMNMTNNVNDKLFRKTFILVPNGKIDRPFKIKFVLKNAKTMYVASTVLTSESVLNPGRKDNCFSMHSSVLHDFFDEEKKLVYNLYVDKFTSTSNNP